MRFMGEGRRVHAQDRPHGVGHKPGSRIQTSPAGPGPRLCSSPWISTNIFSGRILLHMEHSSRVRQAQCPTPQTKHFLLVVQNLGVALVYELEGVVGDRGPQAPWICLATCTAESPVLWLKCFWVGSAPPEQEADVNPPVGNAVITVEILSRGLGVQGSGGSRVWGS